MRISHIEDKDDVIRLETYITQLTIDVDREEELKDLLERNKLSIHLLHRKIHDLVEKWQR